MTVPRIAVRNGQSSTGLAPAIGTLRLFMIARGVTPNTSPAAVPRAGLLETPRTASRPHPPDEAPCGPALALLLHNVLGPSDSSCSSSAWVPTPHFTNTRFKTLFAVLCEMPPVPAAERSDCPTYSAFTSRASAAVSS